MRSTGSKENDYDYYLYLYEGLPVGFQDNVYNVETFRKIVDLPSDDYVTAIFIPLTVVMLSQQQQFFV